MKISAVVILYNPDKNLLNNINSYMKFIDKLYIVDNSPKKTEINFALIEKETVEYIFNNENQGIAKSLNKASTLAIDSGYDYLLTMDQDSAFVDFANFINCLHNIDFTDIAMVSANPSYEEEDMIENCSYKKVLRSITSGSILNLKLYDTVGGFDESLFIDEVDFDYCLKAKILGYDILLFENIYLKHNYGTQIENIDKYRVQYPPIRVYYMTRNKLYMASKYGKMFPEYYDLKNSLYQVVYKKIFRIFKYEDDKYKKIMAIFKGLLHFITRKYGKYE